MWRQSDDLHAALAPGYFRPRAMAAPPSSRAGSDPHAATLVAEAERAQGSVVPPLLGAVLVRLYDTPADPTMVARRRAHIEAIVVDERHRRAGIGTALMNAASEWGIERGAEEIVLTVWAGNAAAEAFYARLGYGVVSRALCKSLR